MKKIKVKFIDNCPGLDPIFLDILQDKYDVELSNSPDYLFCSVFGNKHFLYDDCIKIFYTGENITPNFNLYDYALGFDYITYGSRYLRLPLWRFACEFRDDFLPRSSIEMSEKQILERKFCNFVYSNGKSKKRIEFFHILNNYRHIDSGGKFMNNIGTNGVESKLDFQRNYKFSIAFENTEFDGYTTEKIIDAYKARSIPIYWGNPKIAEELNPDSFINCYDYDSLDSVAKKVADLDKSDDAYLKMLKAPIFAPRSETNMQIMKNLRGFIYNIIEKGTKYRKDRFYWYNEKYNKHLLRIRKIIFSKSKGSSTKRDVHTYESDT